MKKLLGLFLFLLTLLILTPFSAKADGGLFYPGNYPVYEEGQKAFIYYSEGVENIVVQPSYRGSAKDFVWVMPTPSEPQVNKSSQSIFTALQKLTSPDSNYQSLDKAASFGTTATVSEDIKIIEEKTIDSFDVVTLKASNTTALSDWMKTNKYNFPEDKNYLLSDYINQGWYFVISKIRPEAESDAQYELNNGTITPIRFTFRSDKMIYPMKLTRIAMEQGNAPDQSDIISSSGLKIPSSSYQNRSTDIIIYALSNNRVQNSQLNTTWANWLKTKDIKSILAESTENDWIQSENKLFLTKMDVYASADQIKDDFVLSNYKNNDIYPIPFYKEGYYWSNLLKGFGFATIFLLLSPLLLLFIIFSIKQKYEENWLKKGKWLKVILLAICLLFVIFILFVSTSVAYSNSLMDIIQDGSLFGATIAFMILEIVLIVLTIKDFKRQKAIANEVIIP